MMEGPVERKPPTGKRNAAGSTPHNLVPRIRKAEGRTIEPVRRRSRVRRSKGQIAFAVVAIIIVLSMVGSVVASIAVDLAGPGEQQDDTDAPLAFEEQQQELIDEQLAAVEANPNDFAAIVRLAQSYQLANQPDQAITWFERALAINPNDVPTRLDFADMLTQAGRQNDAELQYFRVLEIDPANVPAMFYLGDLYQFWQPAARTDEAVAQFQRVVMTSPTSALATTARERLGILGAPVPDATPIAGTPTVAEPAVATPIA
ncbi:MAG TPA: tetratricopeptide repeat protein [Thermomicrobiales bacterium]|jgi:tetratricopeptide (TPR) repeat protein|nr:tetratricopeptide repeat protein [Thermomicrobiales bacterium]